MYNLAHRHDDELIDRLADDHIAYVPFFPLGGFSPLQSDALTTVATRLDTLPMAVALAWLLHRSPNVLLIPGTSSIAHLRDNINGARLAVHRRRRRRPRPDRTHIATSLRSSPAVL